VEFQTRSKSCVLDDLVAKLGTLPQRHPDRPNLIRMILGLRDEIERPESNLFPAPLDRGRARTN
jgi:hypothetical protein